MNIVAHPIDKKVSRRAHPSKHDLIAVTFTLRCIDSRSVFNDVTDTIEALLRDQVGTKNRQTLRNLNDGRRAFQCIDFILVKGGSHYDKIV